MVKIYDDLDTFFGERGLRRRPANHDPWNGDWWEDSYDYGVWWKDDQGRAYRLTWLGSVHRDGNESGELYAVRQSGPHGGRITLGDEEVTSISAGEASGLVIFFGTIPPSKASGSPRRMEDANAEKVLDGWAEACGWKNSLAWVAQRMDGAIARGEAKAP